MRLSLKADPRMTTTSCREILALRGLSTAAVGIFLRVPPYVAVVLSTATSFQPTGSGYATAVQQ
jgi:hypothetical protein